jgi:hypothetical protein
MERTRSEICRLLILLSSAVERDVCAMKCRVGYWFTARTRAEEAFRPTKASRVLVPGAGTIGCIQDGATRDWEGLDGEGLWVI